MGSWHIFRAIASKKAGDVKGFLKKKKQSEPVDKKLPFNIHIGSSIKFDQSPYIVYGDRMNMKSPGKNCIVAAYGKIDLGGSKVHRFYLYDNDNEENTSILQIVFDEDNSELEECRLFKSQDEIYPKDEDEWGFWLDEEDGSIGWHAFQDKSENVFERVWGNEDSERIDPVCFSETVFLDKYGENVSSIENTSMLYGRWIDEDNEMAELAFISVEESDDESALIQIYTGIDIMPESFNVNY